ncbi:MULTISPECIES: ATP-grasp domain-containing protein [unclassified Arsukibacterium]|uniref:ATP-grasp domain-containing protein n=1 Tax=unclassified Arsukibacterium TaxID=2635278 RepID=UPI000C9170C7|nr:MULTISPECIES: RimK family alpha-L-glutamate ligase [unclassified Arsukibacterium]MAA96520.1 RimK family alpha-L-glutamate ligase [Rheinheimera sp.]HAW94221.1 RimK family alpha-L-glutamate ligase [Candidatus Azambacteria bacterium]|tara:strand:+ start:18648 stop:19601 length:954 start_codon:yes stop_codon:yes gene_type:complete
MNICILSTDQEQDDQRLLDAARAKGHKAERYNIRDISMVLTSEKPVIYWRDQEITKSLDAIIPRLNVNFTDYGTNVLQQFICSQTYVSESPAALRLGRDKLKSLQYLLARGLPFPATGIAYTPQGFRQLAKTIGIPMIVKLIESTEGTGIFLAKNLKEMDNIVKTFGQLGASYIIQSFITEAAGTDVRAFVVGGKVVAAMCRRSQDGDFRSNVALGGRSEPYQLTAREQEIVLSATAAIGINVAGVDFVRSDSGPMLLEVNVSPDFTGEQGIENITGVNIADAIIDHVVGRVCNFYQHHYTSATVLESPRGILCADG